MERIDKRKLCRSELSRLCKIWEIISREPKTPEGDPCVLFPGHLIRKPDPCIYSQFLLMQLNQPVTWDNPDVRILLNGAPQNTYNLTAGTEYQLEITIHNSSRDKQANGTTVHVRWVEFGAGGQTRHGIATLTANVPVWPGTDLVQTNWRTPETPGHYCIEVELVHPDDANPANNRGWNNTQVYAANSPVTRPIRIFNQFPANCPPIIEGGGPYLRPERALMGWGALGAITGGFLYKLGPDQFGGFERVVLLGLIGYVVLALIGMLAESLFVWVKRRQRAGRKPQKDHKRISCNLVEIEVDSYEFKDEVGKDFDPDAAFQGKAVVWPARVEPHQFMFTPGDTYRDVDLIVDAPDDPGPSGVFNVNVRQGGEPAGGVTVKITKGGG
ncbi:MAG: hypothetical protein AB2795_18940 [Candidatus Thiodiazotropha endolucinida]